MALYTVSTGNTILAADINQLVSVLQRPAGQTESGHYVTAGNSYADQGVVSAYIASQSRNATPVSVSVDTSDVGAFGTSSGPTTNRLTSGGFQVYVKSSGTQTNCGAGGLYTIQY
jgi:hypothetical protein